MYFRLILLLQYRDKENKAKSKYHFFSQEPENLRLILNYGFAILKQDFLACLSKLDSIESEYPEFL